MSARATVKAPRPSTGGQDRPRVAPRLVSSYRLLLAVVLILLGVSVVMVLSASSVKAYANTDSSFTIFKKQLVWVGLGLVAMLIVSRIDYRVWRRLSLPLLLGTCVLLVLVLAIGKEVDGGRRWLVLPGGQTFQPSELAKLALLLVSADALTRKEKLFADVRHQLVPVLPLTVVICGLIILEKDLGTTMLAAAIAFGLLFLAGVPMRLLTVLGGTGMLAGFALIMSAEYRRSRFFAFLDPAADPLGDGMHILQSMRAFGEGGLFGVGLGQGFSKWGNVPNAHTDFIFAVVGEELGLLGALGIVALFTVFAYAGVRAARAAAEPFGRYLAGGVTIWVTFTAVVNMGAVVGVLPITGVPLPLVSFGGSSMVVLLGAIGMMLNVSRAERLRAATPILATSAPSTPGTRRGPTRAGGRGPTARGSLRPSPPRRPAAPAGDGQAGERSPSRPAGRPGAQQPPEQGPVRRRRASAP